MLAVVIVSGSVLAAPGVAAPTDGRVSSWGRNSFGRLGNNSTVDSAVPVAVAGTLAGKTVTAVSAGAAHSCAVADGRAYCWGYNYYGLLGNGTTTDSAVPVAVAGVLAGKTVTAVSAGDSHACAVADGKAFCWGYNSSGQLGNNTTTDSSLPVAVAGMLTGKTVTAVSAGNSHTCVVADGKAFCWGYNSYGQLGNGANSSSSVPVAVDTTGVLSGRKITAIGSGFVHSCAVVEGRAACWGRNTYGELGNSTTTTSSVPVPVSTGGLLADKTVTAISAGGAYSCALADGAAYCWGYGGSGQLGNGTTSGSTVPVAVSTSGPLAASTVAAISAGSSHAAVLAAAAPHAPTAVGGRAADGSVTVSWTPPTDDGGSPVIDYTATATPGGATCTSASTSCTVGGLTNGTGYTFTVTARNNVGFSNPSAPSAPVTPAAATGPVPPPATPAVKAPGKVKRVKVKLRKRGTRGVKVTWKRAARATSYRVRISKPGGKKYRAWKQATKRTMVFKARLRTGKKYRVKVRAVGPGGRGPVTTKRFTTK